VEKNLDVKGNWIMSESDRYTIVVKKDEIIVGQFTMKIS